MNRCRYQTKKFDLRAPPFLSTSSLIKAALEHSAGILGGLR